MIFRWASVASALTLAMAGCSGSNEGSGEQATEGTTAPVEATAGPAETVVVASRLGPTPSNCEGPVSRSTPPGFGLLFGENPVWFGPYSRYDKKRKALHLLPDSPRTELGWRIKVLWLVSSKQEAPVYIVVESIDGGALAPIELAGGSPQKSVVLDPKNPGAYSNPNTADFPSYVYFPKAECFVFEATWPDGEWRIVLGVGR